jgi:hypothetical protein
MIKTWTFGLSSVFTLMLAFTLTGLIAQTPGGGAQNDEFLLLINPGANQIELDQAQPCQILGASWGGDAIALVADMVWGYDTQGDSLLCNPTNNNYAGKIVVARRGVCNFSLKALNAQNAGAVAVIILNNATNPNDNCVVPNPGAGPDGPSVTVPTILASQVISNQIRNLLAGGATVGEIRVAPFGPRDVKIVQPFYTPLSFATPLTQIATDTFGFSGGVFNSGSQTATNVKLQATITNQAGNVLYDRIISFPDVAPGDTAFSQAGDFPLFVPSQANGIVQGNYTINYTASADGMDARPSDNSRGLPFVISDTLFSKENGPQVAFRPGTLSGTSYGTGNLYTMSPLSPTGIKANTCIFTYATNPAPDPPANAIDVAISLLRVKDGILPDFSNFSGTDFPGESVDLVGFALFDAPASQQSFQLATVELFDFATGDIGVPLDPGARYFLFTTYGDDSRNAFQAFNQDIDNPFISTVVYNGQWFLGGFQGNPDAVIRMGLSLSDVSTEEPLADNTMSIFPNPVRDQLRIQMNFETPTYTNIAVADLTGRIIMMEDRPGLLNDQLEYNLPNLSAGTYMVRITTAEGALTKKFVVVK